MKRSISVLLLLLSLLCWLPQAAAGAESAQQAAGSLYALGLFQGVGQDADGQPVFDLNRTPTRSEAVVMLVRLLGKEAEAKAGSWKLPFSDVADWAVPYVGYAYANGLTKGTGNGTFGGNAPTTAAQYITFVLRAMGYTSGTDFQWDSAWTLSDRLGFTNGTHGTAFLRGDVALLSYRALDAPMKSGKTLGDALRSAGVLPAEDPLIVRFLDVGQADSILISCGSHFMLIDAGNNADDAFVVSQLKAQGVAKLDYAVGTHPHEDHIGGLDTVLRTVSVGRLFLPDAVSTTKTFSDVLTAVEAQGLTITEPKAGSVYALGSASFTILGPLKQYAELNDASICLRLTYGGTSFLFCGDAETAAETDLMKSGQTLSADVLKLSHHGSSSSTSEDFLRAVSPAYAVISCGQDNDYGHPHAVTLDRLRNQQISLFRTDLQGTITAKSDGKTITWSTTPVSDSGSAPVLPEEPKQSTYILNTNTKKFHRPTCRYVDAISPSHFLERIQSRESLLALGYVPCGTCKP